MKELEACIAKGLISKTHSVDERIIGKELVQAQHDLDAASDSLEAGHLQWTCTQAYYCVFHAAKALLYAKGYKERSHPCLAAAVKELYENEMERKLLESISELRLLREEANYELSEVNESAAESSVEEAREFLSNASKLLKSKKRTA